MITADFIFIGILIAGLLLGSTLGFSKGLKFFTSGIFGKIISVVVCYFLFGIVLSWNFVQELLLKFTTLLKEQELGITDLLLTIRIDLIVFGVALFAIVQIARKLAVSIVAGIFEAENRVMLILNKVLGVVLYMGMFILIGLIVLQIIAWVNGTDGTFYASLQGSVMGIDKIFANNPLNFIISSIRLEGIAD